MRKPGTTQNRKKDSEGLHHPDPLAPTDPHPPADTPCTSEETPDEAVEGRDRLSENEDRGMDPGLSDSAHS